MRLAFTVKDTIVKAFTPSAICKGIMLKLYNLDFPRFERCIPDDWNSHNSTNFDLDRQCGNYSIASFDLNLCLIINKLIHQIVNLSPQCCFEILVEINFNFCN